MPKNRKIKNKKEKTADTVSIGGEVRFLRLNITKDYPKVGRFLNSPSTVFI